MFCTSKMRRVLLNKAVRIKRTECNFIQFVQRRFRSDSEMPPLLMYPTASPHVYISSVAIDQSPEGIHPKALFTETKSPPSFQQSQFRYVSPAEFDFKLPGIENGIPEVAFLGRSNVGKSSLLNSLTTKHLAKTSKRPGRTQQVNYFGLYPPKLDGEAFGYIIDLPGYGYAKAPDEVVAKWQKNTQDFLQQRIAQGNLRRIYILVDARRGMDSFDSSILGWLDEAECDYTVIMTKVDAVGKAKIVRAANEICMRYHAQSLGTAGGSQGPFVHATSSRKNRGIIDLMWAVDADFRIGADLLRQLNLSHRSAGEGGWGKE